MNPINDEDTLGEQSSSQSEERQVLNYRDCAQKRSIPKCGKVKSLESAVPIRTAQEIGHISD